MRICWKRFGLAVGIAVSLILSIGQPAIAAPYWQEFTVTAKWHCTGRLSSDNSIADVRACVVVNGNYAQPVVRVRNTISTFIDLQTVVSISSGGSGYEDSCNPSNLGGGLQRACFGSTMHGRCGDEIRAGIYTDVRRSGYPPWSSVIWTSGDPGDNLNPVKFCQT